MLIEAAASPYPLRTERAAKTREDRPPYRPCADSLSVEPPAERSPRLSDSTSSSSLARRAALTSRTSGKEHPNCRALFCTATWRRLRTTEARAGETPFWTRAKRSSTCSGVQLRRDTRTMLDYSCCLRFPAATERPLGPKYYRLDFAGLSGGRQKRCDRRPVLNRSERPGDRYFLGALTICSTTSVQSPAFC